MKILVVISSAGIGGTQRVAITLASWIKENKHDWDVVLVSLEKFEGREYVVEGIPYIQLRNEKSKVKELIDTIKQEKPSVVLSMGTPMSIYTVPACVVTKTKHIISERNDPSHFSGKKIVKLISRIMMKTADGYVFQTNDARDYYKLGKNKKSLVIPNPLRDINSMPALYEGERKKRIVSVGRLVEQKNQMLLIDSFAMISSRFSEYELVILGEGNCRDRLEKRAGELGISKRVKMPGASEDVYNEIYDASVFVLSSDYEGLPNALMEAMALGLPCISTDCPCGGPKDLIRNGDNGLLVSVGSIEEMAHALSLLLSEPEYASKLGRAASNIRYKFSTDEICMKWCDFLQSV